MGNTRPATGTAERTYAVPVVTRRRDLGYLEQLAQGISPEIVTEVTGLGLELITGLQGPNTEDR